MEYITKKDEKNSMGWNEIDIIQLHQSTSPWKREREGSSRKDDFTVRTNKIIEITF